MSNTWSFGLDLRSFRISRNIMNNHNATKSAASATKKITEGIKTFKKVETEPPPLVQTNAPVDVESSAYDYDAILDRMFYWKKGIALHHGQKKSEGGSTKYVLFDTDCGGFNNIRMGFEYMFMMAYVMDRTLVFPPPHGWYLIDWGPRKRMKSADTSGLSDYPDYFLNEHMQMAVPTISTAEYLARER
eukprot:UN23090